MSPDNYPDLSEFCNEAIAAGHDCAIKFSTAPVHPFEGIAIAIVIGLIVIGFIVGIIAALKDA